MAALTCFCRSATWSTSSCLSLRSCEFSLSVWLWIPWSSERRLWVVEALRSILVLMVSCLANWNTQQNKAAMIYHRSSSSSSSSSSRAVQAVALSQNFAPAASKNATQEYLRQGCDTVILQHARVRHLVVVTKTKWSPSTVSCAWLNMQ